MQAHHVVCCTLSGDRCCVPFGMQERAAEAEGKGRRLKPAQREMELYQRLLQVAPWCLPRGAQRG